MIRRATLFWAVWVLSGCSGPLLEIRPVSTAGGDQVAAIGSEPYEQGKQHLEKRRFGLALGSFRTALERDPNSVPVLNAVAVAYEQLGRFDLAAGYYEAALLLDPNSVQTLNNLGYSSLRKGDVASAIGYFERALMQDTSNSIVVANLTVAMSRTGQGSAVAVAAGVPIKVRRTAWVERTNRMVQTLVTRPEPASIATARRLNVDPALFKVHL